MYYQKEIVCLYWYHDDPKGQSSTIKITNGGEETPLSVIRLCGMEIPPSRALDMSGSPYLIIGYLQRDKQGTWSLNPIVG